MNFSKISMDIALVGMALVFRIIWPYSSQVVSFLGTTAVLNSRLMAFSEAVHAV